jgi:hypothetical protein
MWWRGQSVQVEMQEGQDEMVEVKLWKWKEAVMCPQE